MGKDGQSLITNLGVVEVTLEKGSQMKMLTHIHAEEDVKIGDMVKFKVLPILLL